MSSISGTSRTHGARQVPQIVLGGAFVLALGGCAERGVIAAPGRTPSSATWALVWVAGAVAAALIGLLLTLPVWRRRTGARLAVSVLTAQTGVGAVTGAVLTGAAVRSWQLVDRATDSEQAVALVRLSRVDGDAAFLLHLSLLLAGLTVLTTLLSAACARLAAGSDWPDRSMASALLAVELGVAGYLAVRLGLGDRGLPYLGGALAVPLLLAAVISCLPRRADA